VAFYFFVAHNFTTRNPFLTPRLLLNRNYILGLMLVGIFGMLNITPMVILPPLLRQYIGFPDILVGLVIASRGVGALTGFVAAIWLTHIEGRVLMTVGFSIQIVSGLWLMTLDLNLTPTILFSIGFLQGIAIGIIWVPLSTIAFGSLSMRLLPEATGIYHLIRNLGASLFISICVAEIVRTTTKNYGRMAEFTSPFNEVFSMPWVMGDWSVETASGLAWLSDEITRQAVMLGYLNAFALYTIVSAIAIPLVLMTGTAPRPVPQDVS
jgi:DHA2 family multidrug resistance protein